MPNLCGTFGHLTCHSRRCLHCFRVTSKQLFQPLKTLKFIFTPDQSSLFNPESFRIERMSYKNISICLSELHADKKGLKKNLDSEKSKRGEFSQLPAHQVRVAKSAIVSESIESTKMKLSHLSPSIQRLRRVATRNLPRSSSPENGPATPRSSTKPLNKVISECNFKHGLHALLYDFCDLRNGNDASTASFLGTGTWVSLPTGSSPAKPSVKSMLPAERVNTEAQEQSDNKKNCVYP